ncbi:MAG: hypothetical protein ABR955_03505 [Verrucomicrobiota bacterium]|jgi:hypothetical protein
MDRQSIIKEITRIVGPTDFGAWRIGLTHEPEERKTHWKDIEKKDVSCWTIWRGDSLSDAQAIESYFINVRGMIGGGDGNLSPSRTGYIYIF